MSNSRIEMTIYLAQKAQIALLLIKKITVLANYANFTKVFLKKLAKILLEQTNINEHAIKLKEDEQLPYRLIYSLGTMELETFKIYIKTNLANRFIRPLKSAASALILFVYKFNNSLYLCIDY